MKFFYKEGCWFCDMAEEMLNGLIEKHDLRIERIDIASSEELYDLYRFDIPVIEFADGSALYGRIKKRELLERLEANAK
ncbi:MAG TPA: glutaredoxin family protein [Dissulfurispiraceae bacterium]|nr:glutaredoxin family protein [Dissulfurispiraceae bacterium]